MKKSITIFLTLLSFAALAQNTNTIESYYYNLNEEFFVCDATEEAANKENRKKAIEVLDIKNGYVKAKLTASTMQMTLFKDKANSIDYIVAVAECGLGCMCNKINFFKIRKDGEVHLVDSFFPQEAMLQEEKKLGLTIDLTTKYELPQIGTVIKIMNAENNKHLYNLKWNGNSFVVQSIAK